MLNQCGCNFQNGPFEIFTGQDKVMSLRIAFQNTGLPLDLTDCTAITVSLPNADGTFLALTLASSAVAITSPPLLGSFTATITAVQSALLNVGELQDIDVSLTISGLVSIVRFPQALSVLEAS
jgi:hypothetical protein